MDRSRVEQYYISNDDIKSRIYNKASPFICGVDPYLLIQPLIEENVITTKEWQQIEKEYDRKRQRCRLLYNHLKRCSHPRAFVIVKETLETHRHPFLNELENAPSEPTSDDAINVHSVVNNDQVQLNTSLQERVEKLEKELQERDEAMGQRTVQATIIASLQERVQMLEKELMDLKQAQLQSGKRKRTADPPRQVMKRHQKNTSVTIKSVGRISVPSAIKLHSLIKLDENIYVLCYNPNDDCNTIRVYEDRNEFRLVKEISLDGVKDGEKLTCCGKLKCLYLYESKEKFIWIIKLNESSTGGFQFYKWLHIVDIVHEISVSRDDHLWVLYYVAKLEIYDGTNATLRKRIEFADDIGIVTSVTENRNGHFIISHSLRDLKGPWVISQLNSNMEVTHRFEPSRSQKLSYNCNSHFDSLKNRLIVADICKQRIHLIDVDSFNFVKTLLNPGCNNYIISCDTCYDERKCQLITCHLDIEIFELSWDSSNPSDSLIE